MAKIGIMGGTFDPIHMGHMQLAGQALTELGLDKILFVPNHIPWMKKDREITPQQHRLEMVRLAIEDFPMYELSMVEMETGGLSYTYQTLAHLKKQYPDDTFYFILGADSLLAIEQWMHPEKIMHTAILAAAVRDDCDRQKLAAQQERLVRLYQAQIVLLTMSAIPVSSTKIRAEFYNNPQIAKMLPDKVADYIRYQHLYEF
jgi:nicotinate-nucleotide adenylyltransferase